MDLTRGLITRIIDEQRLNEVHRSGIGSRLLDDQTAQVFSYIERHYAEYKKVPSRSAVIQSFPNFEFTTYTEPLEYFIDALKESHRRTVLEEALYRASKTYVTDTRATERILRDTLSELSITQRTFQDVDLASTAHERIESYSARKENPGATGVLSQWPKIDYVTLGWQAEQLIVLVGEKYQGKSWLMLWLAYQAMKQGEKVLFVTKEMSTDSMANRFDSIYANVKFDSLRRGELSATEEARYKEALKLFGQHKREGSIVLARHGVNTVADIESKAVETDATIVFADSVYLFSAEQGERSGSETQRRMAVSQRCKAAASNLGIPFLCSTQAGRRKSGKPAADMDNIEWSNAFSQDADVVLMITKDDVDKELNRLWVHVLKSRDGDVTSISVKTDFEYMTFEQDKYQAEPSTEIDIDGEESETMWNETSSS